MGSVYSFIFFSEEIHICSHPGKWVQGKKMFRTTYLLAAHMIQRSQFSSMTLPLCDVCNIRCLLLLAQRPYNYQIMPIIHYSYDPPFILHFFCHM